MKQQSRMVLIGGWAFIIFAILFVGIPLFVDLAMHKSYLMAETLQVSLSTVIGTESGIHSWLSIYAILPLLLIPGMVAANATYKPHSKFLMKNAKPFLFLAIIALIISDMLVPSVDWHFAYFLKNFDASQQEVLSAVATALNNFVFVYINKGLGGISLSIWFILASIALGKSKDLPRWISIFELVVGVVFLLLLLIEMTLFQTSSFAWIEMEALVALWFFIYGVCLLSHKDK